VKLEPVQVGIFGDAMPGMFKVTYTKREEATLRSAAKIAHDLRVTLDMPDSDEDTAIAGVLYGILDMLEMSEGGVTIV